MRDSVPLNPSVRAVRRALKSKHWAPAHALGRALQSARPVVLAVALVGALAVPAVAQPAGPPASVHQLRDALRLLDLWLESQVAFQRIPALSAGVVLGQDLVWHRGYGHVDDARSRPAGADTLYSICSISKLFTSVAAMQLWEAGKLGLDEDITRLRPGLQLPRNDPDSGPVTVRSLLTHSSGLPREPLASSWLPDAAVAPDAPQILADLPRQRSAQRVAERHDYSNLGMAVLGEVVAATAGQPYAQWVQAQVLAPLQMQDTLPRLPTELLGNRLPRGHASVKRDGTRDVLAPFDMQGLLPAAGYSSTVNDLAKFAAWQFRLLRRGGQELLRVATLRDMHRVQWADADGRGQWGLGFSVTREGANTVVGHSGRCPGYETAMALVLKEELAVIGLANAQNAGPYTRQMRQLLLKGLRLPEPKAAAPGAAPPDLAAYAGRYGAQPWGSELVVVPWGAGLAMMYLPNNDPASALQVLRHMGGDSFQAVRDDGSLGFDVVFRRDAAGKVINFLQWSSVRDRLAPIP